MLREIAKYSIVNALWLSGYYQRLFANFRVPLILMYHRTRPNRDPRVSAGGRSAFELGISKRNFEAHVRLLLKYRRPIPMDELARALLKGDSIPEKAVALTFDDGYRDSYEIAYPILKEYGVPATFYICPGLIDTNRSFWWDDIYGFFRQTKLRYLCMVRIKQQLGEKGVVLPNALPLGTLNNKKDAADLLVKIGKQIPSRSVQDMLRILVEELHVTDQKPDESGALMTWSEIKEMARNGMDFGSHTMTHPMMTQISEKELQREVLDARARLQDELGQAINGFVYPSGDYDSLAREVVMRVGHRYACTSDNGLVTMESDPYALKRVSIPDGNMALACRELVLTHVRHGLPKGTIHVSS